MPTKPILLDSTGQSILTEAQAITTALQSIAAQTPLRKISSAFPYAAIDAFDGNLIHANGSSNGIDYVWTGSAYEVSGTATNTSARVLFTSAALPNYINPGQSVFIKYATTDPLVRLRIIIKDSSDSNLSTTYFTEDGEIVVPADAAKWTASLYVSNGSAITGTATVSDIRCISAKSNAEITAALPTAYTLVNKDRLPTNTDLDNVKDDGRWVLPTNYTYTHLPFANATGTLEVLHTSNNTILQRFTGTSTGRTYVRTSSLGSFSGRDWNRQALYSECLNVIGAVADGTDLDTVTDSGIYFLQSGRTYTHSPYASSKGGMMLVFRYSANSVLQIAMNATDDVMYYRTSLLGAFPATWEDGKDVITNNYTSQHYENTYTITCEPTITTDTNNYLASTGDNTDRTADIQAMLNSTGICRLGPGVFYTSGIEIPNYGSLEGCGTHTMLRLLSTVTDGYAVKLKTEGRISNLRISGGTSAPTLSATVGTRHGIVFEGTKVSGEEGGTTYSRSMINNVWIKYFEGGGITCTGTGVAIDSNMVISDCFIDHCGAGIYIPYYSEFHRICNCSCTYNWYGVVDNGGNNNFANCDFSGNKIGILIDNSSNQSPNNAHGTFSSCSVNHSYSDAGVINEGVAIKILGSKIGEIFTGMQIFFGDIVIDDCVGIRFVGANMGSVDMDISDSKVVTFADCTFRESTNTMTFTNNTALKFTECYLRDGTSYEPVS